MADQVLGTLKEGFFPHLIVKQCCKLGIVILICRNINLKYEQGLHTRTEGAELKIRLSYSKVGVCGDSVAPSPHTHPSRGQTHSRRLRAQPRAGTCIRHSCGPDPACPGVTQGASRTAHTGDPSPRDMTALGWDRGSGVLKGPQEVLIRRPTWELLG